MAVAFDAFTDLGTGNGNLSATHTPVGTPKAVIVLVAQATGGTDEVTGVTYGSLSLTEVSGSPNLKAATETMVQYGYFAGGSIPTGPQTVTVTVNGTASPKVAGVITLTASADTELVDVDATINSDSVANPSVTLSLSGRTSFCCLGFGSGAGQPNGATPLTSWTSRGIGSGQALGNEHDYASQIAGIYTYDTIGTADVTAGWTQAAEDAVAICLAVSEVAAAGRTTKNTRSDPLGIKHAMEFVTRRMP